ncbi:MAG: MOSC domain-containing protein [Campylobacteraceae bacterium]|nr:MOSC domain-containing protein [Campylobacteraceae bacterium]
MSGKIVNFYIAKDSQSEIQSVNEIVLLKDSGIFGDRYSVKKGSFSEQEGEIKPKRQVTLIEKENIDDLNILLETNFDYGLFRRNILVSNCDLNALVGKEFSIGNVVLKGIRLCEPCSLLSKRLNNKKVLKTLIGKGGLRAEIIQGGRLVLSDQIEIR